MIPVLLHIGPLTIYSYGAMMATGFIVADILLSLECKRRQISAEFANSLIIWGAVGGIAGSRIYDVFDNWAAYAAHPWSIVFSGSGFVWYGGFIGGVIAVVIVARRYHVRLLTTLDMCAPALILGQAFGRMGCLLSGDGDWGLPSTLPWAMAYPKAIVGWGPETVLKLNHNDQLVSGFFNGVRVHPTPIYEALLYVAIFVLLWTMRKRAGEGQLLWTYLVLEGLARFMVEFLRINPRVLWGLSEAQLISLVMIAIGATGWYYAYTRRPALSNVAALRA